MKPGLGEIALLLTHIANERCSGDPRQPYVALMTAASIAGHILNQTPEQLHEMLDKVQDIGLAKMLEATETKQ